MHTIDRTRAAAVLAAMLLVLSFAPGALAASVNRVLEINVNESLCLKEGYHVQQAAVANPEIADVVVMSDTEIVVIGKQPGGTTLHVWYEGNHRVSYEVRVSKVNEAGAAKIEELLGYPGVDVRVIGDTTVLEGTVRDQNEKNRAEKIALAYTEKVVNLLNTTAPQQIRLEARILEITTDQAKKLGISYGSGDVGVYQIGQGVNNSVVGQQWGSLGSYSDINATISALIEKGEAEILSQPQITTLSGEKANILIGGQIPVPVAYDNDKVSVEWKDYGIKLDIEPTVDAGERIRSVVKAEVSSIDFGSSYSVNVGGNFSVPPLKTRKAEAVVDMPSGATMAIGGLISSEESKSVSKVPLLGDLPVLGQFFRHTATTTERKEIVILITPTLTSDKDVQARTPSLRAADEKLRALANPPEEAAEAKEKKAQAKKREESGDGTGDTAAKGKR